MPQLFPPEILNNSAESYYNKFNIKSRMIYIIVTFLISLLIVSMPFVDVDITTQSRGVIRTPFENTLIQSAVYAEIKTNNLAENKPVIVGDTLLILNTERLDEQIISDNRKKDENLHFINDISNLLNRNRSSTTPKYQSEYQRYLSKVKEQNTIIEYFKKDFEVSKQLYEKRIIPEFEYLQKKNSLDKSMAELVSLKDEYTLAWQTEQTRLELESQDLDSHIKQLEKEKHQYILIAPTSGTLVQVSGFQSGNFISPNQTLAYISPADSLLAECYISPKDIGYLQKGQNVVFQMDAFNYRDWGMVGGQITEILNDIINVQDHPMFRVRCQLQSSSLKLKNGYEGSLKKGMTLTGRFHLTRRSLWQLLFDKLDDWMNPKIITKTD